MTYKILKEIIERNKIPEDVVLMSDSGWECDATHMDGVFYNARENKIIFTQTADFLEEYIDDGYEVVWSEKAYLNMNQTLGGNELNSKIKKIWLRPARTLSRKEENDVINMVKQFTTKKCLNFYSDEMRRIWPFLYTINDTSLCEVPISGIKVGYIGVIVHESAFELYIFIHENYRRRGYAKRVLQKFTEYIKKNELVYCDNYKRANEVVNFENAFIAVPKQDEVYRNTVLDSGFSSSDEEMIYSSALFQDELADIFVYRI